MNLHGVALIFCAVLTVVQLIPSVESSAFGNGNCSPTSPCEFGCCSTSGGCGYGPAYCGAGNCTSSCNATAECGQYASPGEEICPLNVCCSPFGFCGTTSEFCGDGCQEGCAAVERPSCAASSIKRRIGYYEAWNTKRPCDTWEPSQIDASLWTHLYYSFALISPEFKIASMNSYDTAYYPQFTGLKAQNPALSTFISLGGWDAGGQIFSEMVGSPINRNTFITSAVAFMRTFGFDGIDVDWEYPAAPDRGGVAADTANFVLFMQELRSACGSEFGISMTLPSSYWYLQGFDIVSLEKSVNWFNFMSYDIHGTWDGDNPNTQKVVNPHTNLTEISNGLDLLWRNQIPPEKVVLGLAFYGRSFTLENSSCNTPGCAFSAGGTPGTCTQTSGILSNAEIQRIITANNLTPTLDQTAGVKWISWDTNQWASYDDAETYTLKKRYADSLCLSGTMVWAIDFDDPATGQSADNLNLGMLIGEPVDTNPQYARRKIGVTIEQNTVNLLSFWTECSPVPGCPDGFQMIATGHGRVFDAELGHTIATGCTGGGLGFNRALCIESNIQAVNCRWAGKPSGCNDGCAPGELLMSQNSWIGGASTGCLPGAYSSYCCEDVRVAPSALTYCDTSNSDIALSGGMIYKRRSSSGYFVNPAFGTGVECMGWLQEQNWNPTEPPKPEGYYQPDGLILNAHPGQWVWNAAAGLFIWFAVSNLPYPSGTPDPTCTSTVRVTSETTKVTSSIQTRTCSGNIYPQACAHYSSVARNYGPGVLDTYYCKVSSTIPARVLPDKWDEQHDISWRYWIPIFYKPSGGLDKCNKDEWPPFVFQYAPGFGYIRFLSEYQNKAAGSLWRNICNSVQSETSTEAGSIYNYICTETLHVTYTVNAMTMQYVNMPLWPDDGIEQNSCVPTTLTNDYGYALLNGDFWYYTAPPSIWSGTTNFWNPPASSVTFLKQRPRNAAAKRWIDEPIEGNPDDIIVDEGNTTRRATDQELWDTYQVLRCQSEDCGVELKALGVDDPGSLMQDHEQSRTFPAEVEAKATQTSIESTTGPSRPSLGREKLQPTTPMPSLVKGLPRKRNRYE